MFGERVSIGIPCGRSESSPTLHLIVMMLHVLAQLFAFTRFPFMSGKVPSDAALTWDFHVELLTCVNVGLFGLNVDFPR